MAWKYTKPNGKIQQGKGYAYLDTPKRRLQLQGTVEFANAHIGEGTHWIEDIFYMTTAEQW